MKLAQKCLKQPSPRVLCFADCPHLGALEVAAGVFIVSHHEARLHDERVVQAGLVIPDEQADSDSVPGLLYEQLSQGGVLAVLGCHPFVPLQVDLIKERPPCYKKPQLSCEASQMRVWAPRGKCSLDSN